MSSTLTLVSVAEYLTTSYQPDVDYVEGRLVERAVHELPHSICQRELIVFMGTRRREWGIGVYPEQRVQVSECRFRVPDITVTLGPAPKGEGILKTPPFLCIEIQSPEDSFRTMTDRVADFQRFGVPHTWVIDPEARDGWTGPAPAQPHTWRMGSSGPVTLRSPFTN